MGLRMVWLCCRGQSADEIHEALGLRLVAALDELTLEEPFSGVTLADGWHAVIAWDGFDWLSEDTLRALSADCEVVAAFALDTTNDSGSELWRNGVKQWRVRHSGESAPPLDEREGAVPERYAQLRVELARNAASDPDVDWIREAPLRLAEELTGFNPENLPPSGGQAALYELEPIANSAQATSASGAAADRPWWKLW